MLVQFLLLELNLFYIVFVVLLILLSILNLQSLSKKTTQVLGMENETNNQELKKEKIYWEQFLSKQPTYYDGWKRMSEIEFLLGDTSLSEKAAEISKRIDFNR